MKPYIVECTGGGRFIISPLGTGEISVMIDCGRGMMGALASKTDASELCVALIGAIRSTRNDRE